MPLQVMSRSGSGGDAVGADDEHCPRDPRTTTQTPAPTTYTKNLPVQLSARRHSHPRRNFLNGGHKNEYCGGEGVVAAVENGVYFGGKTAQYAVVDNKHGAGVKNEGYNCRTG